MFLFQGSLSFISRTSHCGSQLYSGKHTVICFSSRSLKILCEDTAYLLSVLCLRDIGACLRPPPPKEHHEGLGSKRSHSEKALDVCPRLRKNCLAKKWVWVSSLTPQGLFSGPGYICLSHFIVCFHKVTNVLRTDFVTCLLSFWFWQKCFRLN